MTDRDLGSVSKRDVTRLPLAAKAGMIAGLGLGTLSVIACGAETKKIVGNPDGDNTPVPQATATEAFTATPMSIATLTPTVEKQPVVTPETITNFVDEALKKYPSNQDTETIIMLVRNGEQTIIDVENNPDILPSAVLNAYGNAVQRITQLACDTDPDQKLVEARKMIRGLMLVYGLEKESQGSLENGETIAFLDFFSEIPPNCKNLDIFYSE